MSNLPQSDPSRKMIRYRARLDELQAESERIWAMRHQNPLDSSNDRWTGNPAADQASLYARAMESIHSPAADAYYEEQAKNVARMQRMFRKIEAEEKAQRRRDERRARKEARKADSTRRPWWKIWQ